MQTFVPYTNDHHTARCLDNKRLLKQIIESSQIIKAINDPSYGWQNHPAVRMWRGYVPRLVVYTWNMQCEYMRRRGKYVQVELPDRPRISVDPLWWGGVIHSTHRSNLLRKLPSHYSQFNWRENSDIEYYWPV